MDKFQRCPNCDNTDEGTTVFHCDECDTTYCWSCALGSGGTVRCPTEGCDTLVIQFSTSVLGEIGEED